MILKVEKYFLNGLGFKLCVAFPLSEADVNSKAKDVQRLWVSVFWAVSR